MVKTLQFVTFEQKCPQFWEAIPYECYIPWQRMKINFNVNLQTPLSYEINYGMKDN